jgi:transcriptional regulator with XRE-family HTH domain
MNEQLSVQEIISNMKSIHGVTDEDIASRVGVTAMTVWRWGNGKNKPRSRIIIRTLFDYMDKLNNKK